MVVIIDTSNHPGSQPLPRVENFLFAVLSMLLPGPPDVAAKRFDAAKMKEVKDNFKPKSFENGGGCMMAAYEVLDILYGKGFGDRLKAEVITRAYEKADDSIKNNPGAYKNMVKQAMEKDPKLTEAEAKHQVRERLASNNNSSDHTFALLGEKGLAGEKVHTPNKEAEDVIRRLTPAEPGAYFFGLAVRDNHTVTLAVEKFADGTQKMYWLDQTTQGQGRPVEQGKLGDALQSWVFEGTNNTNIYALRPPPGGKP